MLCKKCKHNINNSCVILKLEAQDSITVCSYYKIKSKVRFQPLEGCEDLIPKRAHSYDGAYDLKARENAILHPGEYLCIPAGFKMQLPHEDGWIYLADVSPRSGMAAKQGVSIVNSPGRVDSGFRGEVGVVLINHGENDLIIRRGDRIAQMVIHKVPDIDVEIVPFDGKLDESDRGENGWGSTGK